MLRKVRKQGFPLLQLLISQGRLLLLVINLEEEVLEIPDIFLFIDILVAREEWKMPTENSAMLDISI